VTLVVVGEVLVEVFGSYQLEDGVAKELESLVVPTKFRRRSSSITL
jgi:hypothetical protein